MKSNNDLWPVKKEERTGPPGLVNMALEHPLEALDGGCLELVARLNTCKTKEKTRKNHEGKKGMGLAARRCYFR
uniref:Uncharacterized protein n=1 Tax=Solanum lycopersicum TaxID=4081 RepID=A0A3Q7EDF3_SOLLC